MPLVTSMKPRIKRPTIRQGDGAPTFCWHCHAPLATVKDRPSLFRLVLVRDELEHEHRIHGQCLKDVRQDHKVTVV